MARWALRIDSSYCFLLAAREKKEMQSIVFARKESFCWGFLKNETHRQARKRLNQKVFTVWDCCRERSRRGRGMLPVCSQCIPIVTVTLSGCHLHAKLGSPFGTNIFRHLIHALQSRSYLQRVWTQPLSGAFLAHFASPWIAELFGRIRWHSNSDECIPDQKETLKLISLLPAESSRLTSLSREWSPQKDYIWDSVAIDLFL